MVAGDFDPTSTLGTSFDAIAEFDRPTSRPGRVRRIGRVRIPIALHYRPWATLYVLPDGRREWVLRLWQVDHPVPHLWSTGALVAYARRNRLDSVVRAIEEIVARVGGDDATC
jgi:hypothetical protein